MELLNFNNRIAVLLLAFAYVCAGSRIALGAPFSDARVDEAVRLFDEQWLSTGAYETAVSAADTLVSLGTASQDDALVCRGLIRLAFAELKFGIWRNDWEEKHDRAVQIAEQLESPHVAQAEVLLYSGYLDAVFREDPDGGNEKIRRGLSIARATQDDRLLACGYCIAAQILTMQGKIIVACDFAHRAILFSQVAKSPFAELAAISTLKNHITAGQSVATNFNKLESRWDEICRQYDLDLLSPFDVAPEETLRTNIAEAVALLDQPLEGNINTLQLATLDCYRLLSLLQSEQRWGEIENYANTLKTIAEKLQDKSSLEGAEFYSLLAELTSGNSDPCREFVRQVESVTLEEQEAVLLSEAFRVFADCALAAGDPDFSNELLGKSIALGQLNHPAIQMEFAARVFHEEEMRSRDLVAQINSREESLRQSRLLLLFLPVSLLLGGLVLLWQVSRVRQNRLHAMVQERTQGLQEAKEQAEKANRAKDQFLARINHEIRNPLSSLVISAELLSKVGPDSPRRTSSDRVLQASARHLVDVVDDVLDFTKIEAGVLALHPIDFSLADTIDDVAAIVSQQCAEGVQLQVNCGADIPARVFGDQAKLRQSLVNLGCNAAQHTTGGTITIDCAFDSADSQASFSVRDTGTGMEPGQLAGIFDIYASDRGDVGVGLGLYITRGFVEVLGGDLKVESKVGQGSQFSFTIPLEIAAPAASPVADSGIVATSLHVLLVDDEELNRQSLGLLIESTGHCASVAGNWAEVESCLDSGRPNLIMLDLRMPGVDGFEMAKRIRKRLGDSCPQIFALTGDATETVRNETVNRGFSGLIAKPTRMADLIQLFESIQARLPTS